MKHVLIPWLPKHKITIEEEDRKHLEQAYRNADWMSVDPSTQNGSVFVSTEDTCVDAANFFPTGVMTAPERWERPLKYDYIEHAERNAIYAAARLGISTERGTLYCPWYACCDCARAIIQSGVRRVVGHKPCYKKTPDRWRETIIRAFEMLNEGGVECSIYDGRIFESWIADPVSVRFNESEWTP